MSLFNCSSSVLRCNVGLANVSRLILNNQSRFISSEEILRRESQVIAHNYDPLPVVIAKGKGMCRRTFSVSKQAYIRILLAIHGTLFKFVEFYELRVFTCEIENLSDFLKRFTV